MRHDSVSPASDSNATDGIKRLIDRRLFDATVAGARQSPRRRTNFNFHASLDENPHRFLNAMLRDTYFTPHRHLFPPKAETFLLLAGRVAFFMFEDDGSVRSCDIMEGIQDGQGAVSPATVYGVDIVPGVWHSLLVLSESALIFEVKPGPYTAADDKEFAPWAPREGQATPEAIAAYQQKLRAYVDAL